MGKLNLVLDLDNTLISSVSMADMRKHKHLENRKLKYKDMDDYYRVFYRPHLSEFLKYVFKHFDVTVWTAASRDYATFIIEKIMLEEEPKKRKLKMFLYDHNCDQSQKMFKNNSPKDLRYLYNFDGYHSCNTIIMDDLSHVYKANPKQTIKAVYFDAKVNRSEDDTFLLTAMTKLDDLRKSFKGSGCSVH